MKMNPDLKVEAQNTRVGEDTQNIYTDTFMESLTGVANALDNGKKIYSLTCHVTQLIFLS